MARSPARSLARKPAKSIGTAAEVIAQLLLDQVPGALAAFSLRKLRADYAGSAIRVRRSSDNTEQDIGFVDNALDTTALLNFAGAGDAFVVTQYNQGTGDASDLTQATAALQPRIVNAGVLETVNGFPNVRHNLIGEADAQWLSMSDWPTRPSDGIEFDVFRADTDRQRTTFSSAENSNYASGICHNGSTATTISPNSGTPSYYKNGAFVATHGVHNRGDMFNAFVINALLLARHQNVDFTSVAWVSFRTEFTGFAGTPTSDPIEYQFERVIYDHATLSAADVSAIEQNIADYYGLTLA